MYTEIFFVASLYMWSLGLVVEQNWDKILTLEVNA